MPRKESKPIRKTTKGKGRNYLSTSEGAGMTAAGSFLRNEKHYVYLHRIPETNEVFYVGLGKYNRCNQVSKGNRNKYWINIYNKYGRTVEVVEKDLTLDEAKSLEVEYIKYYSPKCNLTKGGDAAPNSKKIEVHSYDLKGNYISSYESILDAVISNGGSFKSNAVSKALDKQGRTAYGLMWRTNKEDKIASYKKPLVHNTKEIHCYNKEGCYIKSYAKVKDVIKDGFSRTGVSNVINKNNKTCGGCFFNEEKHDNIYVKHVKPALKKPKKVIDNSNGVVYESISEAAKAINCNRETLRRKLIGQRSNNTNMSYYD